MDNDIDRFAQTNFQNFSPAEKKSNISHLMGFAVAILGAIAFYCYIDNKRKEKYIAWIFRCK